MYLEYLSDGDVPFFRVLFSGFHLYFSGAGSQNMSKEGILLDLEPLKIFSSWAHHRTNLGQASFRSTNELVVYR